MKYLISTIISIILLTSNALAEVQNIQLDRPWSSYINMKATNTIENYIVIIKIYI